MASCFLFQKFSASALMYRLTARAATIHETVGNVFHGSAAHLPGMTGLSNRGIHGYATKYFKQIFSSSASKQAQDVARKPELSSHKIAKPDVNTTIVLLGFSSIGWAYVFSREDNSAGSNKGLRCNCKCHCSDVKGD